MSAAAWVVVILDPDRLCLSSVYRQAVERSFDRRLNLYLRTLIAEVVPPPGDGDDKTSQALGEPLFELPLSGWYWQITRLDSRKPEVRSSRSLWDRKLPKLEEQGIDGQCCRPAARLRRRTRGSAIARGRTASRSRHRRPLQRYRRRRRIRNLRGNPDFDYYLFGTFVALTIGLLLTTLFQVRFGLAPLKRITAGLAAIRSGQAERLEGVFPVEIAPFARETNALLDANKEIVERARTHVGNLAHAVKTPLSVIVNEASAHRDEPFALKVLEQADMMRDQVAHHLERARIAARLTAVTTLTDVTTVVDALHRTMEKIHRNADIEVQIHQPATFRGERQDLEEMVGNLIDNACKWSRSQVLVEVILERQLDDPENATVRIIVDDDGPGLSPAERAQVARRGQRLDETKPGSGLGLSIVSELAALYRGSLTLGTAPIGGLRAELILPAG